MMMLMMMMVMILMTTTTSTASVFLLRLGWLQRRPPWISGEPRRTQVQPGRWLDHFRFDAETLQPSKRESNNLQRLSSEFIHSFYFLGICKACNTSCMVIWGARFWQLYNLQTLAALPGHYLLTPWPLGVLAPQSFLPVFRPLLLLRYQDGRPRQVPYRGKMRSKMPKKIKTPTWECSFTAQLYLKYFQLCRSFLPTY